MFKSGQCAPAAGKRRPTTAEEIQKKQRTQMFVIKNCYGMPVDIQLQIA